MRGSGTSTKQKFFCYIAQKLKYYMIQWSYLLKIEFDSQEYLQANDFVSYWYKANDIEYLLTWIIHNINLLKKTLIWTFWISSEETFPCFALLNRQS